MVMKAEIKKATITKLIQGLMKTRQLICGYESTKMAPDHLCDCKYGANGIGEQTGCPEIADAIDYLSNQVPMHHIPQNIDGGKKPVRTIGTSDGRSFEQACQTMYEDGYEMASSSCGFVNSEIHDFCEMYQAIFVLKAKL